MDELQNRLLAELKKIKGIDGDGTDDVFLFALKTAIYDVLNYCHIEIEDWPKALDSTTILMTIDLINEASFIFKADAEAEGEVKSLTEGDFSISRETKADAYKKIMSAPSFARNYRRNLNSFRRLAR